MKETTRTGKELGVDTRFWRAAWGCVGQVARGGVAGRQTLCVNYDTRLCTGPRIYPPIYICIYLFSIVLVSFHHAESEGQGKLRYLPVEISAKCVAKV